MKRWFDRADANHDGAVTLDEFINDAKTQFQRMDIDKNDYLVSEEVERFRMTYRDYQTGNKPADDKEDQQSPPDHHGKDHTGGSEGSEGSVIDPVMSADANLDYKVTLDEFTAYSQRTFKSLDADHNATLNLGEVTAICGDQGHEKH